MHMMRGAQEMARGATVLAPVEMPSIADEVNHRVANHLQLIASLISAEARGVSDPETLAVLERTQLRIAAIGGVHRHLYVEGTADVDLGWYLEELGERLSHSCPRHRRVLVDAETMPGGSAAASSLGILATELVTNACKHAYAAEVPGDILVTLRRLSDGTRRFTVEGRRPGKRQARPRQSADRGDGREAGRHRQVGGCLAGHPLLHGRPLPRRSVTYLRTAGFQAGRRPGRRRLPTPTCVWWLRTGGHLFCTSER
jgi:two-component sensor histidine kinase